MQSSFRALLIALAALWTEGDFRYRIKASRLRFRRRMVALWPLWLALLATNLIETPVRRRFADGSVIHDLWVRLHELGLGLAGAIALLIMIGVLIEASIKTSAKTPMHGRNLGRNLAA
jgi:hypothetical protein